MGYTNPLKAVRDHVDEEDKGSERIVHPFGGGQKVILINESGLYSLILKSKLPSAKNFKHWVTSEVLPSIRKNGGYIAGQETLSDTDLLAKAFIVAYNKIEEKDKQISAMKPKAIFADAVAASKNSILVGDLAKLICQNGIKTGQNRLFEWLREKGYLIKNKGQGWNMPTQKSVENNLFEIKETVRPNKYGNLLIHKVPVVTGKGQHYFIHKFLNDSENSKNTKRGDK